MTVFSLFQVNCLQVHLLDLWYQDNTSSCYLSIGYFLLSSCCPSHILFFLLLHQITPLYIAWLLFDDLCRVTHFVVQSSHLVHRHDFLFALSYNSSTQWPLLKIFLCCPQRSHVYRYYIQTGHQYFPSSFSFLP